MTTPASSFLKVERDGPVALILMNRPDKANSMTPDFCARPNSPTSSPTGRSADQILSRLIRLEAG